MSTAGREVPNSARLGRLGAIYEIAQRILPVVMLLHAGCASSEIPPSFLARFYPDTLTTFSGEPVPLAERKVVFARDRLTKGGRLWWWRCSPMMREPLYRSYLQRAKVRYSPRQLPTA